MRRLTELLWRAPRRALMLPVRAYRLLLSPWVGQSCRFTPTCSAYALQALDRHGAVLGGGLVAWRLLRCNPLCHGGCDPVPDNPPWKAPWKAWAAWKGGRSAPTCAVAPNPASGLFTGLKPRNDLDPEARAAVTGTQARLDPPLSKSSP